MPEADERSNAVKPAPGQPSPVRSGGPLSADQLDELEAGRQRARKVRRAAGVASFSGWSMALFSLISFAFGLSGDWASIAAGVVLAAAAFNELKGGERLKRFEIGAAKQLGYGQMVLGVVIVIYAAWSWYSQSTSKQASSGDAQVDAMMESWMGVLTPMVWGSVGAIGLIVCWLTASYYFSRAKVVRQLRERTPPWVVEVLQRAG
jgi:hypothetical protein